MSYNITFFKLKKISNFEIPFESFFKNSDEKRHPEVCYEEEDKITIEVGEYEGITGNKIGDIVKVTKVNICGEFSGRHMDEVVIPALKDSSGYLECVCVWEGGCYINRIIANNGTVSCVEIEL